LGEKSRSQAAGCLRAKETLGFPSHPCEWFGFMQVLTLLLYNV
jgi:hypothetical protein